MFDQVNRALKADFQALGPRTFKNIAHPVDVFAIAPQERGVTTDLSQEIRFCTAPDGVQLAYSMIGQGRDEAFAVRAARDLSGLRGLDRVRRTSPRASLASDPLRRLRAGF